MRKHVESITINMSYKRLCTYQIPQYSFSWMCIIIWRLFLHGGTLYSFPLHSSLPPTYNMIILVFPQSTTKNKKIYCKLYLPQQKWPLHFTIDLVKQICHFSSFKGGHKQVIGIKGNYIPFSISERVHYGYVKLYSTLDYIAFQIIFQHSSQQLSDYIHGNIYIPTFENYFLLFHNLEEKTNIV